MIRITPNSPYVNFKDFKRKPEPCFLNKHFKLCYIAKGPIH